MMVHEIGRRSTWWGDDFGDADGAVAAGGDVGECDDSVDGAVDDDDDTCQG